MQQREFIQIHHLHCDSIADAGAAAALASPIRCAMGFKPVIDMDMQ
jgi:hypothetical protein